MADKNACDAYSTEVTRRFEEFVQWSRSNWPIHSSPLLDSEFDVWRENLKATLTERLEKAHAAETAPDPAEGGPQYVSVNPAPWP